MLELLAALALAVTPLPSDEQASLRVGAWDRSVELERAGDLRGAQDLLLKAWGPEPESYEVTVRLAWLASRMGRTSDAIQLYRRARQLPGAGPEATRGLSSALSREGFEALDAGDRARAKGRFLEVLALAPDDAEAKRGLELAKSRPFDAELWLGGLVVTSSEPATSGAFGFVHARFRPTDALRLRAAYRFTVTFQESTAARLGPGPGSGRSSSRTQTRTRHEGWAGVGLEQRSWRAEALGLGVFAQGTAAVPGQAVRLSVGERLGVALDEAALFSRSGTNLQLRPMLFAWPTLALGFGAGTRVTRTSDATRVAAEVGVSIVTPAVEVYFAGLAGKARTPVFLDVPLIVDVSGELVAGGALSVLLPVGDTLALGASAEAHALDADGDAARYASLAAGLRWAPRY